MPRFCLLTLLLLSAPAWADTFHLEGPPATEKSAAMALAKSAEEVGLQARVVRRFRQGAGWEYVALVEGFTERSAADTAAVKLADATGASVSVFEGDPGQAKKVRTAGPPPDLTPEEQIAAVMAAAVKAHGGVEGGAAGLAAAKSVRFEYRRTVPGGLVAKHVWAVRGRDLYLDVVIESGDATSSRSGIVGEQAWLAVSGGTPGPEDLERTREALERFSPARVLGFPLEFASAVQDRPEFQDLELDGTVEIGGRQCDVLRHTGGRSTAPLALAIDVQDHRVRRVTLGSDAGDLTHEFSDWREVRAGLVVPGRVRTWRDAELVDEIELIDLSVDGALPDEWFVPPSR